MILSATLSKPVNDISAILGKDYIKIKINYENSSKGGSYYFQMFTKTQVFHEHLSEKETIDFLDKNIGISFKSCVEKTDTQEITFLTNKKGKTTKLVKQNTISENLQTLLKQPVTSSKLTKNYLLKEGTNIPFLTLLGITTSDGKVISKKYDKFKQINRFLEFIDDIIPNIQILKEKENDDKKIRIIDFGCGKSYLTFAVQYYLTNIKKLDCEIHGLDLKKEVIDYCNEITQKLNLNNLSFSTGSIETYKSNQSPDLIITLHACDTATDYALQYAVEKNTKAILSVPCCQHQINTELSKKTKLPEDFSPLLKWGFIREKFSALLTDSLRGEWLEKMGYKVQMLEFIDEEHTPKNLLIRAVKKESQTEKTNNTKPQIIDILDIHPQIWNTKN